LPASSLARTLNVCRPSARPVKRTGELHAVNSPASTAHSKSTGSSAVKVKVAVVWLVGSAGRSLSVIVGAVVSTVQV
jgi:hypothetical protein